MQSSRLRNWNYPDFSDLDSNVIPAGVSDLLITLAFINNIHPSVPATCLTDFAYDIEGWCEPCCVDDDDCEDDGIFCNGNEICVDFKDETCEEVELCNLNMQTVDLREKSGLFYMIQKTLGKKKFANVEFNIEKNYGEIDINWTRKYVR